MGGASRRCHASLLARVGAKSEALQYGKVLCVRVACAVKEGLGVIPNLYPVVLRGEPPRYPFVDERRRGPDARCTGTTRCESAGNQRRHRRTSCTLANKRGRHKLALRKVLHFGNASLRRR